MREQLQSAPFRVTPEEASSPSLGRARDVVERIFGPPSERSFTVRYWDRSEESPGFASDRPFTLWFKRSGAMRRMLVPPSELAIAEAFINGDVDIEGNAEYAMHLGDVIGSRIQSLAGVAELLPRLLGLPKDDAAARADARKKLRFSGGVTQATRRGCCDPASLRRRQRLLQAVAGRANGLHVCLLRVGR